MKKNIAAVLLLAFGLVFAGCSQQDKTDKETENTESQTETTSAQEQARPEYKALDYVTLGEYKGLEVTLMDTELKRGRDRRTDRDGAFPEQ